MSLELELFCAPVVLEELDREDVLEELLDPLEDEPDELLLGELLELELDELTSHGGAGGVWPLVLASITRTVAPSLCPLAYHACSSRLPSSSDMQKNVAPSVPVANLSTSNPMSFPSPDRNSIG